MGIDTSLFLYIQGFTGSPAVDSAMLFLAEYLAFLIPLTLIYLWFESRQSRIDSLFIFAVTVTGVGLSYVLGLFYFHHQPFSVYDTIVAGGELDNAFPSQHTAAVFSCFWGLLFRDRKRLAAVMGTAGGLTGFGRVFVGLHYPLDILGGIASGLLGLAVTAAVFPYISEMLEDLIKKFEVGIYLENR